MSTRYFAMAELELTFMGHISGSTALRVVPVLFPPVRHYVQFMAAFASLKLTSSQHPIETAVSAF